MKKQIIIGFVMCLFLVSIVCAAVGRTPKTYVTETVYLDPVGTPHNPDSGGLSTGIWIGIGILVVIAVIIILYFLFRKKPGKNKNQPTTVVQKIQNVAVKPFKAVAAPLTASR